jgi:fatty-acyl-CoA synthase
MVGERVIDAVGIPAREVVLVEPGTLPKTSSGKLQRSLCRDRYLSSELVPI